MFYDKFVASYAIHCSRGILSFIFKLWSKCWFKATQAGQGRIYRMNMITRLGRQILVLGAGNFK